MNIAGPRRNFMKIKYEPYKGEEELHEIIALVEKDLSEPYSIFVYRFFLFPNPNLCFLVTWYSLTNRQEMGTE